MTGTPFPISGTLKNLDGSTAVADAKVGIFNYTKGTYIHTTTNLAGEYSLDLANLSGDTPYADDDVLYLYASISGKSATIRAVIASGDETWEQDIYLKEGDLKVDLSDNSIKEKPRVVSITASCSSAKSVIFVEKLSDIQKAVLNISANGTENIVYPKPGLVCDNGFWVLIVAQGTTISNQTAGVSNCLGDKVSNATNHISYVCY
ncbi:MAG: hypothetical protein KAW47_11115 [Thermoplasmatales archaeon]|nr:hypothetical protein [Thermoplasmatales archaeon]